MAKKDMQKAKNQKNDEFYTQLVDIEEEVRRYKTQFNGKVVICNCDDPFESNFVKYFILNFRELGLKKLIATCFDGSPISSQEFIPGNLFGEDFKVEYNIKKPIQTLVSKAYKIEITSVVDYNNDGAIDLEDAKILLNKPGVVTALKSNGDFRSEECLALLDEADICVTNPPFSLLREFIPTMIAHNKKFLILGNMNAITYKEIFPLIKDNKVWCGYKFNASVIFKTPYANTEPANRKYVLAHDYDPDEGYTKVKEIAWFTNLEIAKRAEGVILYESYTPDTYYTYHNYPAINVDEVKAIPADYFGPMGVPITYLDKYNPEQFTIINLSRYITDSVGLDQAFVTNYNMHNKNAIPVGYKDLGYYTKDNIAKIPYMRVIIKRKYKEDGTLNEEA
jgi:hypothetical protein